MKLFYFWYQGWFIFISDNPGFSLEGTDPRGTHICDAIHMTNGTEIVFKFRWKKESLHEHPFEFSLTKFKSVIIQMIHSIKIFVRDDREWNAAIISYAYWIYDFSYTSGGQDKATEKRLYINRRLQQFHIDTIVNLDEQLSCLILYEATNLPVDMIRTIYSFLVHT